MEVRYTPEHEWVSVEANIATIGITDHAQRALGDLVRIIPPLGIPGGDLPGLQGRDGLELILDPGLHHAQLAPQEEGATDQHEGAEGK